MKVVFLSAGKNLRFRTPSDREDRPKTLYEILDGKTVLDINIGYFLRQGFQHKDMIICALKKHERLYERFRNHGIKISIEESPSGTAGAVWNAREFIEYDDFIVRNGDTIHEDLDLKTMLAKFREERKPVIAVVHRELPSGYVKTSKDGKVVGFEEKPLSPYPEYSGTCIFPSDVLKQFCGRHSIEKEIFFHLVKSGDLLYHMSSHELYIPVDTLKDVVTAREKLKFDVL